MCIRDRLNVLASSLGTAHGRYAPAQSTARPADIRPRAGARRRVTRHRAGPSLTRPDQSQNSPCPAGAGRRVVPARHGRGARSDRARPSRRPDRRLDDRRRARRRDSSRTGAAACARRRARADHPRAPPARPRCVVAHLAARGCIFSFQRSWPPCSPLQSRRARARADAL